MKVGFIGLGKMGQQMVVRLLKAGHEVVATDLNPALIQLAENAGAIPAQNRQELLNLIDQSPAVVWLMIPAQFVEAEVAALLDSLPAGSLIIDGGNSNFRDSMQRAKAALSRDISFIDVGTSGGVLGLERGFSLMVGGDKKAVNLAESLFEALAQPDGWYHFGPAGSGHFIKMVHNGIEYGMMQSYAEGYRVLREGHDFGQFDLAAVANVWQHGSIIDSGLNQIVGKILAANPELNGIAGVVVDSGEAEWMLDAAKEKNIEAPAIQASLDVRRASQAGAVNFSTKLLAAMRNVFGGHEVTK